MDKLNKIKLFRILIKILYHLKFLPLAVILTLLVLSCALRSKPKNDILDLDQTKNYTVLEDASTFKPFSEFSLIDIGGKEYIKITTHNEAMEIKPNTLSGYICFSDQHPASCLEKFLKENSKNSSSFIEMELQDKITFEVLDSKYIVSQEQTSNEECFTDSRIKKNSLIAFASLTSVVTAVALFSSYRLKEQKNKEIRRRIGDFSGLNSKYSAETPVKVTVYNNISPAGDKLTLKERFYKKFFGHTVMVVSAPDGSEIVISYPEKDSIKYLGQDRKFKPSELYGRIPSDQISEFYINSRAYENFLIEYKTSNIVYRTNDIFEILDHSRRSHSSYAIAAMYNLDYLKNHSNKPPKDYLEYLNKRREGVIAFLESEIPEIKNPEYILTEKEVSEALKRYIPNDPSITLSGFNKMDSPLQELFNESLEKYDVDDFLLRRYRNGGRIYYPSQRPLFVGFDGSGKPFFQLDPKFKFSKSVLISKFEAVALEVGLSTQEVQSRFIKYTENLSDFSVSKVDSFRNSLPSPSTRIEDLVSYTNESMKQRKYYTAMYDRYERLGKCNCAGAVSKNIEHLTGVKIKSGLMPHRPQGVVNSMRDITSKMDMDISPRSMAKFFLLSDGESEKRVKCDSIWGALEEKIKAIYHNILSMIAYDNTAQIVMGN